MLLEVRYVCEKWRHFHSNHCATLGRQFAQLRVSTSIDVAHISCTPNHQLTYFPVFASGYMFYRIWNWLHFFQRLQLVSRFPAFATGCIYSRFYNNFICTKNI